MKRLPALLILIAACCCSTAQAQTAVEIETITTCLEDSTMVADPSHCVGLHSDACIASGKPVSNCLDQEEAIWATILREHWPFRCASCSNGFSLMRQIRADRTNTQAHCNADSITAKRCLMQETARQASEVFLNKP